MKSPDLSENDGIKLNLFTLSFDEKVVSEKSFIEKYNYKHLKHMRYTIWIGLFFYAIYGSLDIMLFPNEKDHLLFIRLLVCLSFLAFILLSYKSKILRHIQLSLFVLVIVAGSGLLVMIAIAPTPLNYTYYAGLIMVVIFGYTFIRLRFVWATLAGLIIVTGYGFLALTIDMPIATLISNSFILIGSNILCMFACYSMEKSERMEYTGRIKLDEVIKEKKQQAYEMSVLNDMSNQLNIHTTEKETYDEMAKTCIKLFPGDSGHMYVLNNTGAKLEKVAKWGDEAAGPEVLGIHGCTCFQTGKEHFCMDSAHETHCPHQASAVCHEYLCVPISIRGEKIGALHIGFNPSESVHDEKWRGKIESKRALFVRLAEHYAPFLGNLRLRIIDPLTGLRNRIYVTESLEREVRDLKCFGITYFDIDKFRNINEKYDNETGDRLLKNISAFLKERVEDDEIPCRYGGGEFMIVTPELSPSEVAYRAEQLRKAIATDLKPTHNEKEFKITVSFGVAGKPDHGLTVKDVVASAEQALRRAKASGKNRIVVI